MNDVATTEPVIEVYPALSELSSKGELAEHLHLVHNIDRIDRKTIAGDSRNTKVSKERLLQVHNALHLKLDAAKWQWSENVRYDSATSTYMGAWVPFGDNGAALTNYGQVILPHKHADVTESAELRAAALAARTGGQISSKPLPPTQMRLLTEIVRNDFRIIEQEMKEFAAEALESQQKEIRDDYKDRHAAGPRFKKRADALHEKLREQMKKIQEDAAESGIDLSITVPFTTATFQVKGLNDALKEAADGNRAALTRALARLEREKAVALRRVQLAGISLEAVKLLDELPDARQMMIEAASARPKELG